MIKKIIITSFIAWAFAAILGPRPAQALSAFPGLDVVPDVLEVVVTPVFRPAITELSCGDPQARYRFNYLQLITIHGVGRMWVPVEATLIPKPEEELVLWDECKEGDTTYYIYARPDCQC